MKKVLIVEDDPAIRLGLQESLQIEHFAVLAAVDGTQGLEMAKRDNPDVILLDVMLPGMNGDDICRTLRADGITTPIIMLTCKGDEIDRVLGLEIGADDYVTKPFSMRELLARIRAVMRRGKPMAPDVAEYSFGNVEIDFRRQEAVKGTARLVLSAMEFKIVKYFAEHEGMVVTRDMLLDEVWGYEAFPTTRTVDNYILALRKKLEDDPSHPRHLLTVHKAGYRFVRQPEAAENV